jgi:hypothetical protein
VGRVVDGVVVGVAYRRGVVYGSSASRNEKDGATYGRAPQDVVKLSRL